MSYGGANRFKTRNDGYSRRVLTWVCKECKTWHQRTKPKMCQNCEHKKFYYFASRAEAIRYAELLLLSNTGAIRNLETQKRYKLIINDVLIFKRGYYADFVYENVGSNFIGPGLRIVEDVKSNAKDGYGITEIFECKKNLMYARYGIVVKLIIRS